MYEHDDFRDFLESCIKNAANDDARAKLMHELNQYDSNTNEKRKNEARQRLDQNIHDDELMKARDQALIDEKKFFWQKCKDVAEILFKALGFFAAVAVVCKAVWDDKNGEPAFGPFKEIASACIRILFRMK